MKKWQKILIGVIFSVIILVIVGGFIFYRMLTATLPDYSGRVASEHIKNDVKIYRDSSAIPYIVAHNDDDAAFALGYVHAQDRLFSMDLAVRAGEGRLSEIFGRKTVPFDKMFRTVGIKRTAEKILKGLDPVTLNLLKAYSRGVNLYIKNAKGKYPVEFAVLNYTPEKWTPLSSLIIGRMMAWELNISWWTDITNTMLVQKLGADKVKEILPQYPENAPYIIPPGVSHMPRISAGIMETDKAFRQFMGLTGTHIGSNSWVVNGKLSASGKPIIANDTHLAFSAPCKWYAAVINTPDLPAGQAGWNAAGFTIPGDPAVIIGKNNNIAWALTNIMEDDADFYSEKLDSSGTKYFYNGDWKNLKIIKDTIRVKDSSDVIFKIKSTGHGPIVSGIHPYSFLFPDQKEQDATISMHWLGNEVSNELLAFYKIDKAKNWEEFKDALSTYSVPGQNFIYGDKNGNIGYEYGSRLPIRGGGTPGFVYDGTTGQDNWKGFVPANRLPSLFNPPDNYIASANNKTVKNFNYYITNLWEPPSRIERITHLLNSRKPQSVKNFKKYQMDQVSPYARKLTAYILHAFLNVKITDSNLKLALELLKRWNYEMGPYSQVPSIYAVFFKHLLDNVYKNKMGADLFNEFVFLENSPYRSIMQLMEHPDSHWFDDPSTPRKENRDETIRRSLADALTELESKYGKDIAEWQWGRMHQITFKHAFSGFSSIVDRLLDIGPFEIGGDGTTIFNGEYPFTEGLDKFERFKHSEFEDILGPVMRFIYDFSEPNQLYLILTTGESGNFMSDHYSDMTPMWLHGGYLKVRTDLKSIESPANTLLTIYKK